jgi:hypothetical protein
MIAKPAAELHEFLESLASRRKQAKRLEAELLKELSERRRHEIRAQFVGMMYGRLPTTP